MRLWNKSFGNETKVKDFTGREIAKGAYNDRNSEYGWNVDHILPQSRGGKTADYNLVCCHILTNDEKADKFPCFVANKLKFEIVKVENHYEIKRVTKTANGQQKTDTDVNFFDSASGIRLFKQLKGIQNKPRWVGSVLIRLQNVDNTAVIDFVEKFLDEENIFYSMSTDYRNSKTRIVAINYNMPTKEDVSVLKRNVTGIQITLENDMNPRLINIESCYTSTYERYQHGINQIESMQLDINLLKKVVAEHSEKINQTA